MVQYDCSCGASYFSLILQEELDLAVELLQLQRRLRKDSNEEDPQIPDSVGEES
jgi:hypothetical protein